MANLLILGSGISQAPTIRAAKKLGITSIVLDGSSAAAFKNEADKFIVCDIKNHEAVLEIVKKEKINGIVCPGTDFSYTAAYVAEKLGLPGISPAVALMCQNKYEQRQVLKKAGFFVPNYVLIRGNDFYKLDQLQLPIVIKPVDSMAARGIRVTHNYIETYSAIDEAMKFSRTRQVIAEEFVEGMEFSIDALVFNNEVFIVGFADRHFMLYPYFIENGHTVPSILNWEAKYYICETFKNAVKSLGITMGAAKGDIKLTSKGIMIGEIAARISGGFLSGWTYPYSSGIYPHENLIRLHLGEPPITWTEESLGFSAERVLLSIPGKLKEVVNLKQTSNYPGIKLIHLHVKPGEELHFPYNNTQRCGSIISFSKERSDAIYRAQIAAANTILRLEPNNKETIKWLKADDGFRMYSPGKKETDWHNADIAKNLEIIIEITGKSLQKITNTKNFWKYFYRGGIQGGLFCIDSLL
jgi:biotin carboxylase